MHAIAVGKNLAIKKIKNTNKASSLQALKRVGPPNKVQEKIFLVDRSRGSGIYWDHD